MRKINPHTHDRSESTNCDLRIGYDEVNSGGGIKNVCTVLITILFQILQVNTTTLEIGVLMT